MSVAAALLTVVALVSSGCSGSDAADESPTTAATQVAGITETADFAEVDAAMDAFVAEHELNGAGLVVVERDEGVVHENFVGEMGPDRVSLIASASKMLTAGVLLRLEDEGLLDIDAPVADAVDWGAANPDITPAQLISNSSGLVGLIDGPTFPPYLCQYIPSGTLEECGERIFTTTEDDDKVVPPDTKFRYGGAQWQVAGAVAEAASGRSWAELIDETYVEPCGVDSLAYNNHFAQMTSDDGPFSYPPQFGADPSTLTATDNPNMEGGAYITPTDYAQLLLMHLRGGDCEGGRVLSSDAVDRMHVDRLAEHYEPDFGEDPDFDGYGLGWWIGADDPDYIEDGGAFGAIPWLDLGRGYGAYLVIEATSELGRDLAGELRPLIEEQIDGAAGG